MRLLSFALALLVIAPWLSAAKTKEFALEAGVVVAQNISRDSGGAYAGPIGTGVLAIPIYRTTNRVTIRTKAYVYEWIEVSRGRFLILPVNGIVDFHRENGYFCVFDARRKKHKFALLGMRALIPAPTPK